MPTKKPTTRRAKKSFQPPIERTTSFGSESPRKAGPRGAHSRTHLDAPQVSEELLAKAIVKALSASKRAAKSDETNVLSKISHALTSPSFGKALAASVVQELGKLNAKH